ncbi:MAG: SPASM domain-containing protein [Tannerellaceae bacterium]|nr:SPASM domain-containing protein [Tannerellaceae bacterium]
MNRTYLSRKDIFIEETHSNDPAEEYILYAPLKDAYLYASAENISPAATYLSKLPQVKTVSCTQYPDTITELSILLNYICNFSCSYCYSAKGRSGKAMDVAHLKTALSFFIDRNRTTADTLQITFSGGGDPLMSFPLLKEGIEYAAFLAEQGHFTIKYGIVTNGTLLNDEFIRLVKKHSINLVISFDVLEEVQRLQRGKYREVCEGINYLIQHNIYPGIRSTITPVNVHLMQEMVAEMIAAFPALGGIAFEPVLNPSLFQDIAALKNFYSSFVDNYFKAEAIGREQRLYVGNTLVNNTYLYKERNCLGKFTVTPEGNITACSRISSPKEDFYDHFHYGTVRNGKIILDTDKLDSIMKKDVYHYSACNTCIARWHCGGGCLLARYAYSPGFLETYCHFIRKMTLKAIINSPQKRHIWKP